MIFFGMGFEHPTKRGAPFIMPIIDDKHTSIIQNFNP